MRLASFAVNWQRLTAFGIWMRFQEFIQCRFGPAQQLALSIPIYLFASITLFVLRHDSPTRSHLCASFNCGLRLLTTFSRVFAAFKPLGLN